MLSKKHQRRYWTPWNARRPMDRHSTFQVIWQVTSNWISASSYMTVQQNLAVILYAISGLDGRAYHVRHEYIQRARESGRSSCRLLTSSRPGGDRSEIDTDMADIGPKPRWAIVGPTNGLIHAAFSLHELLVGDRTLDYVKWKKFISIKVIY